MNGDLRVLIADDDSGMRMILRRLIEKADGFTLAGEASDGKQAIELAELCIYKMLPHLPDLYHRGVLLQSLQSA